MQTKEERQAMLQTLKDVRSGISDLFGYKELEEFFTKDQKHHLQMAFCACDLALELIPEDPVNDPIEEEES